MIENKIPGTYYFFLGEETAVHKNYPYGSLLAIEKYPHKFEKFKRSIAFDRKEKGQLVTRQLGYDCCSDDFANALILELSKNGLDYKKDKTGYYTDNAFFGNFISEITNLSVGVWNEHTKNEYVDIKYVEKLSRAAINIKWDDLPTVRKINEDDMDPRSDMESDVLSEDQVIFKEVFNILDELYYVCREIRSYTNFTYHFKKDRIYHFTQWHGDEKMDISVDGGKIKVNGNIFNSVEEFKKSLGMEELDRKDFVDLMLNKFIKNNNKLSLCEFSHWSYLKSGNIKKLTKDLKSKGYTLNKIGKGYEIIKESIFIKDFKKFTGKY